MSGALVVAALIGLAEPAPSNPDALQWDELEETAPAPEETPTETAPPEEAAPPAEAVPPEEAPAEAPPPEEAPAEATPPEEAPAEDPPAEEAVPGEEPSAGPTPPETKLEFNPTEPEGEIAELQPPGFDKAAPRKRPPLYGRLWAGPVLGFGQNIFALGVSATYFVIPHIGIGADLVNVFRWGAVNNFYEFQFTPQVTFLALPTRRASPYFWGGFGVDTFNQGLGTYGRWVTGAGLIMLVGRRVVLRLGVEFDGRVPESRWNRNFTCGLFRDACSVGIRPVIGISIPFG